MKIDVSTPQKPRGPIWIPVLALLLTIGFLSAGCTRSQKRPSHRGKDVIKATQLASIAVTPVRNNTRGLLIIPAEGVTGVPGDFPLLDHDPRRNVAFQFREMAAQYLIQKGYKVIHSDDFDAKLSRFADDKVITEELMMEISDCEGVLFITVHEWDITGVKERHVISMDVDFELRHAESGRTLWSHVSGHRTIQLPSSKDRPTPYDLFIQEFLDLSFDSLPTHQQQQ